MTDQRYAEYRRRISAARTPEDIDAIMQDLKDEVMDDDVTAVGEQLEIVRSLLPLPED